MEGFVLKMHYKIHMVEVLVEDTDRTLIIDVYNDMFDAVEEGGIEWPENPSLAYSFKSKSVRLRDDQDLLEMFERFEGKQVIDLWVGSEAKPCHSLLMTREVRSYTENDGVDKGEVIVQPTQESKNQGKPRAKLPVQRPIRKDVPKAVVVSVKPPASPVQLLNPSHEDVVVSVETTQPASTPSNAVAVISPRRSGRLNRTQGSQHTPPVVGSVQPIEHPSPAHVSSPPIEHPSPTCSRRSLRLDTSQVSKPTSAHAVSVQPNQPVSPLQLSNPSHEAHVISPRRSERLNIRQGSQRTLPSVASAEHPTTDQASQTKVSKFKIPRTTVVRKGVYIPKGKTVSNEIQESNSRVTRGSRSRNLGTVVTGEDEIDEEDSDVSYVASVEDEIDEEEGLSDLEMEDNAIISTL
ncbi:hypothetical protein RND81_12G182300 [Saponaria officinalis]|uniref:PB1 domain-containing protein n=1 Tax=Saponaria officinalis TaxID=3572 RepID=A0AAW1HCB8_SAPOF